MLIYPEAGMYPRLGRIQGDFDTRDSVFVAESAIRESIEITPHHWRCSVAAVRNRWALAVRCYWRTVVALFLTMGQAQANHYLLLVICSAFVCCKPFALTVVPGILG